MQNKEMTGYPSIDKPWLKYYSEEAINAPLPECTIYDYLWENNKDNLSGVALNYFDRKITYNELFKNIDNTARGLSSIGVHDGDIVTIFSLNTPETIYSIYALNLLGAIPNMEYVTVSEEEALSAIEKCGSKNIIILDIIIPKFLRLTKAKNIDNIVVLSLTSSMPFFKKTLYSLKSRGKISKIQCDKCLSYKDMLLKGVDYQRSPYIYNKQAIIVHSGGTTGIPKGVLLSNDNMNSIAWQNINYGIDYKKGERFLHSIPPFHAFGLALGIHMPLCLGLTLVLSVKIDEESIYNYFSQYKPNYVIVGPTHALMIVNKCDFNVSFVNMFCLGGAGVTNEQEEQINSFLESHGSKSKACIGYGLSETGSEICAETNKWYGKLGSVGIPFCKANCKIINTDTLEEQKYNEIGEICFSGPGIMLSYYNNEDENNNTLFYDNNEKWLHTGDLGYIDKDGFLFITGRLKRIYPTRTAAGGTFYKLFPDYVESTIKRLDYIKACATVCLEDSVYKNIAIAFVEIKEASSKTEKDILDQLKEILPEHSIPKRIIRVDALPLTPIGKIDYRALEKMAEESHT